MNNLISYINNPKDTLRPLVRIAIVHAQFETIHPFMDGNGRVGRMLIPFYLYYSRQISLPCFFSVVSFAFFIKSNMSESILIIILYCLF